MSSKMHSTVKWDSSEEEDDDMTDAKFRMKLREPYGKNAQPVESSTMETEAAEPRRRGRGPSKRPCLNRNALMARENRQRKKAYLEKIENKLSFYQEENKTLVNTIRKQGIDIKRLSGEVAYLRSVLNNNTAIAALLKTINEGLRKIGSPKRSPFHSAPSQPPRPDSSSLQDKCTYAAAPGQKENEPRPSDNTNNMYVDSSDDFTGYHSTYNSLENASFHLKRDAEHKEGSSLGTTVSSLSQESEDSYMDNIKDLDSILPMASIGSIGDKRANAEPDPLSADFDQLPSFNMDIFEDLPKCDEMIAIDGLHDSTTLFAEEEMFPSLDNTGICLHVNSDKVSLEYCALCHSSSKGAALN